VIALPAPVVERQGRILVVRDDLLPGGTKRRAMVRVFPTVQATEFVYVSPAYSYAQIALAYACADLGLRATVFVAKRNELHPRTALARDVGAKIVQVPYGYLSNVQAKARAYAAKVGAYVLPMGLDSEPYISAIAEAASALRLSPPEVWCVAGSGVLSRALQRAWPSAHAVAVRVGAEPKAGRATLLQAPEKYEAEARNPPPFPSCAEYDAKAWQFIQRQAVSNALFWNVGA
jgi:hypothetical protein